MTSESSELQTDSITKGIGFLAIANLAQRAVGFVRNFLFCFLLSKSDVGLWALASSFFVLAAPLSVLGLPGCFGRFVETFRQRGQLRSFIQRGLAIATVGVVCLSLGLVVFSASTSHLIFGCEVEFSSMLLLSLTLISVVVFNTVMELLSGLRQPTAVSQMQMVSSLGFSGISLPLAAMYPDWTTVVGCYCISMIGGVLPGLHRLRIRCGVAFLGQDSVGSGDMLMRVAPFALTVWLTDLLSNLFDVVDRYMLLHLASGDAELNQAMVGQFHTARILPVLFLSLASMIAGLMLPYWSGDWESNQRAKVVRDFNTSIKLNCVLFWIASIAALMIAPLLFEVLLDGRYPTAQACFPVALAHCVIAACVLLQCTMLRCTELNRLSIIILIVAFAINLAGNYLAVPSWGVAGAMSATLLSTAAMFGMNAAALSTRGVVFTKPTWVLSLLPLALLLPLAANLVLLGGLVGLAGRTNLLVQEAEREAIDQAFLPLLRRFGIRFRSLWPTKSTSIA